MPKRPQPKRLKILRPKRLQEALQEKQRVKLIYDDERGLGTIRRAGPEQSVVIWDENPRVELCYINEVLRAVS